MDITFLLGLIICEKKRRGEKRGGNDGKSREKEKEEERRRDRRGIREARKQRKITSHLQVHCLNP